MKALNYMKKHQRMCEHYTLGKGCIECPLFQLDNICTFTNKLSSDEMELAIEVVRKWNKKHKNISGGANEGSVGTMGV